jgi:hypothetical protein
VFEFTVIIAPNQWSATEGRDALIRIRIPHLKIRPSKKKLGRPHLVFQHHKASNNQLRKLGERLFFLLTLYNRVPHQIYSLMTKVNQQNQNARDLDLDCLLPVVTSAHFILALGYGHRFGHVSKG